MRLHDLTARARSAILVMACFASLSCASGPPPEANAHDEQPAPVAATDGSARGLFERSCSPCHSLELPMSQRLDRANWEWVVSDMVKKYGATWITEEQQRILIDYLTENYGPDRPRPGGR